MNTRVNATLFLVWLGFAVTPAAQAQAQTHAETARFTEPVSFVSKRTA